MSYYGVKVHGRCIQEGPWNDAISIEHRGMQCVITHSTGIRNFGVFFSDAKCLILNVPARMAYPPDRIVIDYPTHLDPPVAVSVRGIFAIGR